jgi:hypothetical protein
VESVVAAAAVATATSRVSVEFGVLVLLESAPFARAANQTRPDPVGREQLANSLSADDFGRTIEVSV